MYDAPAEDPLREKTDKKSTIFYSALTKVGLGGEGRPSLGPSRHFFPTLSGKYPKKDSRNPQIRGQRLKGLFP
jgi:hypothetical protein